MDFDPTPYNLSYGATTWLVLVGAIAVIGLILGLIGSFASAGANGAVVFATGLKSYLSDVFSVSPRRVWALALLTLKEAWRRKALLVFVVFAILLMFAGWFLTDGHERADMQVRVHITFMLTTISWLILPVVMFLSCWGLPEDIRIRSLHTVVTKPVRRLEVVLGRMLGFSVMSSVILLLMGVVGYVWIQRQIPDSASADLKCRVPVYGQLFFLDSKGLPKRQGLNVGDPWLYRSFIEGNTPQRAVWVFNNVTPERLGGELKIESRFEAFRTLKGSDESLEGGVEARYAFVRDIKEDAFSSMGASVNLRDASQALRDGNYETAADEFEAAAQRLQEDKDDFSVIECVGITVSAAVAEKTLKRLGADFSDVSQVFGTLASGSRAASGGADLKGERDFDALVDGLNEAARVLRDRAPELSDRTPRLEVPMETFNVTEFHEGKDEQVYPRVLEYAAGYESVGRFLAEVIGGLSDGGELLDGAVISASLVDTLENDWEISRLNGELVVDVLNEELQSGGLEIADGNVAPAEGQRWRQFFDKLVQEERLVAPDEWRLKADLFDDLAPDGQLRVEVSCLNHQMYLGMARADMFLRLQDQPFAIGFAKALLNIGLMLALVIVIAVTVSCVVKGPVSFFFTLTVFVMGQFFHELMYKIITGMQGGGLLESAVLILQHRNPMSGMDLNEGTAQVVQGVDSVVIQFIKLMSTLVPNFRVFSDGAAYIENGFDVPWSSSVLPAIATFIGFLVPCVLVGAALLKFRELESK